METRITKSPKQKDSIRQEILKSMIASFKIEGINISPEKASAALKKVELKLGK